MFPIPEFSEGRHAAEPMKTDRLLTGKIGYDSPHIRSRIR